MHRRTLIALVSTLALLAGMGGTAFAAAPTNDDFDAALPLTVPGPTGTNSVDGTTREATDEPGEPTGHGPHSVWYTITPDEDGTVGLTLCMEEYANSHDGSFITFNVYTGDSVDALSKVDVPSAFSRDGHMCFALNPGTRRFDAVAHTTYHVRVAAEGDAVGTFTLYVQPDRKEPAANDGFSSAQSIAEPGPTPEPSIPGDNRRATTETGEPEPDGPSTGTSVWYRMVATETAPVIFTTCDAMTELDTVISVFTGSAVDALTEVGTVNDAPSCPGSPKASEVGILAEAGTTYYVRVAGAWQVQEYSEGRFALRVFRGVARPSVTKRFSPYSSSEIAAVNPDDSPIDFALTSAKSATFRCSLDGAAPSPCPAWAWYPAELFEDGSEHTLAVTASIGGYESPPTTSRWKIDRSAPDTVITDGPADGSVQAPPLDWTVQTTGEAGLVCTVDGVEVGADFPCYSGDLETEPRTWTSPSGLCDGPHVFGFAASDNARNVDATPASRTVTTTGGGACAKPDLDPAEVAAALQTRTFLRTVLDPHGGPTSFHVEYGPTTAYGHSTPDGHYVLLTPNTAVAVMDFLTPGTTYHARVVARNPTGETASDDVTFTTGAASGTAPTAALDDPTNVTETAASVSGLISNSYRTRFEYGTTTAYGQVTPTRDQDDLGTAAAHERLTGLQPHTTYHYRLVAENAGNLAVSEDRTFTTGGTAPEPSDESPKGGGGTTTTPAPPAAPPVRPAAPSDSTRPTFRTSGPLKGVRLGKTGAITLALTASENATASFGGSVKVPHFARALPFAKRTLALKGGRKTTVTLRLSRKDAGRVRRALRHRRLTATITVTLRDASGNRRTRSLKVTLRR
jgi:hypothetical protein